MSRSEHDSSACLASSYSLSASSAHSGDQNIFTNAKPRSMASLNILFLGETNIGESSIVHLIAGSRKQKRTLSRNDDDVRSITLDDKTFVLHAFPTSESMPPVVLREGVQNTLTDLRRNGGVHLLVYCMNALPSTLWIHEIHRTIASHSIPLQRTPVVAVIAGMSDMAQQKSWWSNNEGALADQGLHFDGHAFIQMTTTNAQSHTGDHISESRSVLHVLILQHCGYPLDSETSSDFQRTVQYKQWSLRNSFQSLLVMLGGKLPPRISASSTPVEIVLLGEVGVGKSSLINVIAGKEIAKVSSDTIGCTKATAEYTFEEKGRTFHLYDTPGLVDPQMGVKPFVDPIDAIQKLIRRLGNGNGPDLFLFCIDSSKPTVALRRNYRLFCNIICGGKVPFALAITKLRQGQNADQWWSQYKATIQKYGIDCSGRVGFGREKKYSGPHADLGRMRESFLSFFVTCISGQKNRKSFSMGRMVNTVNSFLRPQISMREGVLMKECGLEEQTARELVNRMASSSQFYMK